MYVLHEISCTILNDYKLISSISLVKRALLVVCVFIVRKAKLRKKSINYLK